MILSVTSHNWALIMDSLPFIIPGSAVVAKCCTKDMLNLLRGTLQSADHSHYELMSILLM